MDIHELYNCQFITVLFYSQPDITAAYDYLVSNEAPPILIGSVGQPPPHSSDDSSCVGK